MAKKPSKRSKSTMPVAAAKVFAELAFATGRGMDRGITADPAGRAYALAPDARDFWLNGHAKSIPKALQAPGVKWPLVRDIVSLLAQEMGEKAVGFALADATPSDPVVIVKKPHVKKASDEIQQDKRCQAGRRLAARAARKGSKGGSGLFCAI